MSSVDAPVVIAGAGPAGVSAAWALHARGVPVVMLDAGLSAPPPPPDGDYLGLRREDAEQWRWQLGNRFESLAATADASPKMRVPGLRSIFTGYAQANDLHPEPGFHLVGALAPGGLSNAWGCGVGRFDAEELGPLRVERQAMDDAYAQVARRIGLSGASDDPLREYFGIDDWARPALPLDPLHARIWDRSGATDADVLLGRARIAVLNEERGARAACDLSGTCLWGCARRATWSAALDVAALRQAGVVVHADVRIQRLLPDDGGWRIEARNLSGEPSSFRARRVLLATGTIATTRLVLAALPDPPSQVRLFSNPMAAFLLFLPSAFGKARTRAFGLAQLSFVLPRLHGDEAAMGNLFSTAGLPVNEFLAYLPITRRAGLPLLRRILPATVVGNVFLPGSLSGHAAGLNADAGLWIRGGAADAMPDVLARARALLQRRFRKLGAWMLPGSFVPGAPGADIHYAATLPIRTNPAAHECRLDGQVAALPGLHVIDGASLPSLPAKAHTLTIMANATRIAGQVSLD